MTDTTPDVPTERFLVTMTSAIAQPDGSIQVHKATDHVATADLGAYVADAQTRWQAVTVADTPDTITTPYTSANIPEEGTP